MSGISGISSYSYAPQYNTSFGQRSQYNGIEDFKPGLIDPQAEEKARKRKRNVLTVIGLGIAAGVVWFFTKGKGKGLIKDLIKGSDDVATAVKTKVKKPKVKPRKAVVAEHVDIVPGKPQKMTKGGGKESIHKARRNKKAIIEETRLREQMEAFTEKDLLAYQKSLGTPATEAERAFMAAHNRPATNTLGDIMEASGIQRAKNASGRVVLQQNKVPQAPVVTSAPATAAATAAEKTAKLQAKVAELQAKIAACTPEQAQTRKFFERQLAALTRQLPKAG